MFLSSTRLEHFSCPRGPSDVYALGVSSVSLRFSCSFGRFVKLNASQGAMIVGCSLSRRRVAHRTIACSSACTRNNGFYHIIRDGSQQLCFFTTEKPRVCIDLWSFGAGKRQRQRRIPNKYANYSRICSFYNLLGLNFDISDNLFEYLRIKSSFKVERST